MLKTAFYTIPKLVDVAIAVACLWVSVLLQGETWNDAYLLLAATTAILFYISADVVGLHLSWRSYLLRQQLVHVLGAWLSVLLALLATGYLTDTIHHFDRMVMATWAIAALTALCAVRVVTRAILQRLRRRGYNVRNAVIVGTDDAGRHVARTILDSPWMGLQLLGFYEDRTREAGRAREHWDLPIWGAYDTLVTAAREGKIDVVYITLSMTAQARIQSLISQLADSTVSVYVVSDFFTFDLLHTRRRSVELGGLPAVSIFESPFYGIDGFVKRLEDLLIGSTMLLVAAIPMVIIGIGVRLSSPGPALFRQRRYGRDGKEILVWKFRTMTVTEDGAMSFKQAAKHDTRITPLGAVLRNTSLDELPQLFNVISGSMSLVGPRPHPVMFNEQNRQLVPGYMLRHSVKPGMTGWAQVNGYRGETDNIEKLKGRITHDLWYIKHWSLLLDLKILVMTLALALPSSRDGGLRHESKTARDSR